MGQKRKTLQRIPKHQYFELANGERLRHYLSLGHALETMESHVYDHHVSGDRNDFAHWIKDVFGEEELSQLVANAQTPEEMRLHLYRTAIKRHI